MKVKQRLQIMWIKLVCIGIATHNHHYCVDGATTARSTRASWSQHYAWAVYQELSRLRTKRKAVNDSNYHAKPINITES